MVINRSTIIALCMLCLPRQIAEAHLMGLGGTAYLQRKAEPHIRLLNFGGGGRSRPSEKGVKITVRGRVVNERGTPVRGASVFVEEVNKLRSHLIQQATSDAQGYFIYEDSGELADGQSREREVFVMGPSAEDSETFIGGAWYLRSYLRKHGHKVTLSENGEAETGDIKVDAWYGGLKLTLPTYNRRPDASLKSHQDSAYIQINSPTGRIMAGRSINLTNYRKQDSAGLSPITLSLPEGEWVIKFATNAHIDTTKKQGVSGIWLKPIKVSIRRNEVKEVGLETISKL